LTGRIQWTNNANRITSRGTDGGLWSFTIGADANVGGREKGVRMARTIAELFDLTGQAAIVTGGAMGIGKAIASRLAEARAEVVIADIDITAARATAEGIVSSGGRAHAIAADVALVADADKTVQFAIRELGRIDILVNNAGIYPMSSALEISEELWDKTINVNLKSMLFYSKAAAAAMVRQGWGGKIINMASVDAFRPSGRLSHYDASKGGVVMLTKALASEWAPHGILVNAIAPGAIASRVVTPRAGFEREDMERKAVRDAVLARIPLGRIGLPDDVATVALFLAGHASDYMTGSVVTVDGGLLLA